jgi:DNA mismatch endonuclease (patch repair protein)
MKDRLSINERSAHMAKIKGRSTKSTEIRVALTLVRRGISGWIRNADQLTGRPDFYFPRLKIVIFVDGCFWHQCPKCNRRVPANNRERWQEKLLNNSKRDRRVDRMLRIDGFSVIRIWEHELSNEIWFERLPKRLLGRGGKIS